MSYNYDYFKIGSPAVAEKADRTALSGTDVANMLMGAIPEVKILH